jgi:hypothetical protein
MIGLFPTHFRDIWFSSFLWETVVLPIFSAMFTQSEMPTREILAETIRQHRRANLCLLSSGGIAFLKDCDIANPMFNSPILKIDRFTPFRMYRGQRKSDHIDELCEVTSHFLFHGCSVFRQSFANLTNIGGSAHPQMHVG